MAATVVPSTPPIFSAFDETATLALFRLTALAVVYSSFQDAPNPLYAGAALGYHEALAH